MFTNQCLQSSSDLLQYSPLQEIFSEHSYNHLEWVFEETWRRKVKINTCFFSAAVKFTKLWFTAELYFFLFACYWITHTVVHVSRIILLPGGTSQCWPGSSSAVTSVKVLCLERWRERETKKSKMRLCTFSCGERKSHFIKSDLGFTLRLQAQRLLFPGEAHCLTPPALGRPCSDGSKDYIHSGYCLLLSAVLPAPLFMLVCAQFTLKCTVRRNVCGWFTLQRIKGYFPMCNDCHFLLEDKFVRYPLLCAQQAAFGSVSQARLWFWSIRTENKQPAVRIRSFEVDEGPCSLFAVVSIDWCRTVRTMIKRFAVKLKNQMLVLVGFWPVYKRLYSPRVVRWDAHCHLCSVWKCQCCADPEQPCCYERLMKIIVGVYQSYHEK